MAIPFLHRVLCYIYLHRGSPVPIEILEPRVIYGDHYYFAFTTLSRNRYTRTIRARARAYSKKIPRIYTAFYLRLIRRAAQGFDNKGILLGTTRP